MQYTIILVILVKSNPTTGGGGEGDGTKLSPSQGETAQKKAPSGDKFKQTPGGMSWVRGEHAHHVRAGIYSLIPGRGSFDEISTTAHSRRVMHVFKCTLEMQYTVCSIQYVRIYLLNVDGLLG